MSSSTRRKPRSLNEFLIKQLSVPETRNKYIPPNSPPHYEPLTMMMRKVFTIMYYYSFHFDNAAFMWVYVWRLLILSNNILSSFRGHLLIRYKYYLLYFSFCHPRIHLTFIIKAWHDTAGHGTKLLGREVESHCSSFNNCQLITPTAE